MADWFTQNAPQSNGGGWFAANAPKAASAPQGAGFWHTLGQDLKNGPSKLMDALSGHPMEAFSQTAESLTQGRRDAWQQAKDSYGKGNYKEAFEHLLGSIPVIGPPANQAMNEARQPEEGNSPDETHQGKTGEGLAHGVEALAPYAGPVVEALPGVARTTAAAVRGGADAARETIPLTRYGVPINVPKPIATAAASGAAARMAGLPATPAAIIGGAAPIVRGMIRGARGAVSTAADLAETPGQILAKSNGMDWAALKPEEQMILENAARAQANTASQATAAPRPAPPPQPEPASAAQPVSPTQGMTAADMISAEMAAKRGAQPPAPQPLVGGHDTTPIRMRGDSPLRPPLRQPAPQPLPVPPVASSAPPAAPQSPPPPGTAVILAPPARTLPQVEAAMMQKSPAPINPAETRTQYLPSQQVSSSLNGEEIYDAAADRKSPQLRAAEIKGANAGEKAARWAEALHAEGITAEDLGNMKPGDMAVMSEGMKAKGTLGPKETVPDTSLPMIRKRLKAMELQEALQAEMKKSGSIQ